MTTSTNQPVIVILLNKLQEDRVKPSSEFSKYIPDAEKEYENMCRRLGEAKQIEAIDEMILSLKNGQTMSAKSHAHRAQNAMVYYQKAVLRKPDEKGYLDVHGSGRRHDTPAAPREPNPDYNNYDQSQYQGARREHSPGKRNMSRGEQYQDPRRELSPEKHISRRVDDAEYGKSQYPEHRREPITDKRGSRKREEAAEAERQRSRMDQMSDSMEASVRLRKDNPNLTDLSDVDRPTKLAEKHAELYDNEWTDAFEELQRKCRLPDERAIQCLLIILMDTYERSHRKAQEQIGDIEDEVRRLMTRFKVSTDHGVSETKDMFRGDIGSLKQYRKSLAKLSIPELQRTFESGYLRDILKQYGCRDNLQNVLEYTNKCVELTWLMSVQDPPVILDNMKDRRSFHTEMYKAFTKHGQAVDFYVWPALLLHEGGPLLVKGVAQGK